MVVRAGKFCSSRVFKSVPSSRCSVIDVEDRYGMRLPSFVTGIGSVFDLSGRLQMLGSTVLYVDDGSEWAQDALALASDWRIVGEDMSEAGRRSRTRR
jgi:hypothetical protein